MKNFERLSWGRTFLLFSFLLIANVPAYSDKIKSALKQLNKGNFDKTRSILDKSLSKESENAGAKYVYSLYYTFSSNPAFNLDSSYQYILAALNDYQQIDDKVRKKLNKLNINDSTLLLQKSTIEELAYIEEKEINTEDSYNSFIERFPTAGQVGEAIITRDKIAFKKAEDVDNSSSYASFLKKYPESHLKEQAKENYDLRLFEESTGSGTLKGYISFLANNPKSPYRTRAEEKVYKLSTVLNTPQKYEQFLESFKGNSYRGEALDQLFFHYLERKKLDEFISKYPEYQKVGKARAFKQRQDSVYFVFYDNNQFGFINESGGKLSETRFDGVDEEYLCSGVDDEYVLFSQEEKFGAIDKTGEPIIPSEFQKIEKMGTGVLKAEGDSLSFLYSMTGKRLVKEGFEVIERLDNSFVKIKSNGLWGIRALNGSEVLPPSYEKISFIEGDFFVIENKGRYSILNSTRLVHFAEEGTQELTYEYDEYEEIKGGLLEVGNGGKVGIVDSDLKVILPLAYNSINYGSKLLLAKKDDSIQVFNLKGQPVFSKQFEQIRKGNDLYAVKQQGKWGIIDNEGKLLLPIENDSVVLIGDRISLVYRNNVASALFKFSKWVTLPEYNRLELQRAARSSSDTLSIQYLLVEDKKGKVSIYNLNGVSFLKNVYDKITVLSKNHFIVEAKNKVGIVDSTGKVILPLKYDGIVKSTGSYVSLLQKSKFGLFNPQTGLLIQPRFDAQVKVFDGAAKLFLAYEDGNYAFMDEKGKLLSGHQFKEVSTWKNDTVLVKDQNEFYLYSIRAKQKIGDPYKTFRLFKDTPEEKLAMVYNNSVYGVLSSKHGVIVPLKYNDITNLGTVERPFYMAEHHVEEADLYVVLYINHSGKIVMSQAYKSAEYDKLLCQD